MTPTRAALLRDVAGAIISSGYAYALPIPRKRLHVMRTDQIAALTWEILLDYPPRSREHSLLIDYVMHRYSVSRWTAYRMIRQARKMREENNGAKTQ